jgi:hypothetical protein
MSSRSQGNESSEKEIDIKKGMGRTKPQQR